MKLFSMIAFLFLMMFSAHSAKAALTSEVVEEAIAYCNANGGSASDDIVIEGNGENILEVHCVRPDIMAAGPGAIAPIGARVVKLVTD